MRIDSHQHYWKTKRGDYGWLTPEQGILYADYIPEQLHETLADNGFERTIVVQAAPTLAETEFILSLYEKYDSIAGSSALDRLRRNLESNMPSSASMKAL